MIDSFEKLTIKKYRELIELEFTNDAEYGVMILSILSDIDEDELLNMPLNEFTELMAQTKFIYQKIEREDYKQLGKTIELNGNKYTLVRDAKDLTAGQYIDYKAYIQRENFLEALPYILTVFLIPEGKKYNKGYDIGELAKEFNETMDIKTALSISDFFLYQSRFSIKSSITYLKLRLKLTKKMTKDEETKTKLTQALEQMELLENLINNGDLFTQP